MDWRIVQVLEGRSSEELLDIGREIIDYALRLKE